MFGNPPPISNTSTTIYTRPNFRAAPFFPNLDCNHCPTLTAHSDPLLFFSALAKPRVQASHLRRVLGSQNSLCWCGVRVWSRWGFLIDWLMLLLLLRNKWSSSFAGSSMCSKLFFRFVNISFFLASWRLQFCSRRHESRHTYEPVTWVKSHVWISYVTHMNSLTCIANASFLLTEKWVTSDIWILLLASRVLRFCSHINGSRHIYEQVTWVTSRIWMSHVTHMNPLTCIANASILLT